MRAKQAEITLDISKGDMLLGGRFKNMKTVVEDIGTDELGQPTVNGKKLLSFRIVKTMPPKTASAGQTLTKSEILELLRQHSRPDVGIGAGSAMVLRGLRDSTSDIDADAPTGTFNALLAQHNNPEVRKSTLGSRVFTIPGTPIDLHEQAEGDNTEREALPDVVGQVETRKSLLDFYRRLNREKDQPWIAKLQEKEASTFCAVGNKEYPEAYAFGRRVKEAYLRGFEKAGQALPGAAIGGVLGAGVGALLPSKSRRRRLIRALLMGTGGAVAGGLAGHGLHARSEANRLKADRNTVLRRVDLGTEAKQELKRLRDIIENPPELPPELDTAFNTRAHEIMSEWSNNALAAANTVPAVARNSPYFFPHVGETYTTAISDAMLAEDHILQRLEDRGFSNRDFIRALRYDIPLLATGSRGLAYRFPENLLDSLKGYIAEDQSEAGRLFDAKRNRQRSASRAFAGAAPLAAITAAIPFLTRDKKDEDKVDKKASATFSEGEILDYFLQHHKKPGSPSRSHADLRLGRPGEPLQSWAIPKERLPEVGEKLLAPETVPHAYGYGRFSGKFGKGRNASEVNLLEAGQGTVGGVKDGIFTFSVKNGDKTRKFALVRIKGRKKWLIIGQNTEKMPAVVDDSEKSAAGMVKTVKTPMKLVKVPMKVVDADGNCKVKVDAEVADTDAARRKGLSKRAELPEGCGMFFDTPGPFWMKDVNMPLDVIFMSKSGSVLDFCTMEAEDPCIENGKPVNKSASTCKQKPLKLYKSASSDAMYAIEVPAGWAKLHNVQPGDRFETA